MTLPTDPYYRFLASLDAGRLGITKDLQRDYGASGSVLTTTGTIAAGSKSLTLSSPIPLLNGQGVFIQHAGQPCRSGAPSNLVLTVNGTAGTTTYTYAVCSMDGYGGLSAAVTATVATGPSTTSQTNNISMSWTAPASGSAPSGYAVFVKVGSGSWTYLLRNSVPGNTSDLDQGAYLPIPSYMPSAPPTTPQSGYLSTTVASVENSQSMTLYDAASSSVSGDYVAPDSTAAINALLLYAASNGGAVTISPGDYYVSGIGPALLSSTTYSTQIWAHGARIHALPGTQANCLGIINSTNVKLFGGEYDGNLNNVDNSGPQYTTVCGVLIGSYVEGTGGCTNVSLYDVTGHTTYFGAITYNTSKQITIVNPYTYGTRDNSIFGRPGNDDVAIWNPRTTGARYNGLQHIRCTNVRIYGALSWDNGPNPTSSEGDQLGFEGCIDCAVDGAKLFSTDSTLYGSQGIKVDYTLEGGPQQNSSNIKLRDIEINGIGNVAMSTGVTTQGNGVLLQNCSGVSVDEVSVDSCTIGIESPTNVSNLTFNRFTATNCSVNGGQFTATNGSGYARFSNCDFSGNGVAGQSTNGLYVAAWDGFTFENCVFDGNQTQGLTLSAGTGHKVIGGQYKNNGQNGVLVSGSTGTVDVMGAVFDNTTGTQERALYEATNTSSVSMVGNDISGQTTAPFYLANATSYATRNTGASPQATVAAPTVGASPWTYTNSYNVPVTLYVSGGTVTSIAQSGVTTGLVAGTFPLEVGQSVTVTYTAAPTAALVGA